MNLLARREHSYKELQRKLLAKPDIIDVEIKSLLDQLVMQGLLSDARFTEAYIRSRASRGFGPVRIKEELKDKGIALELIQKFLDESNVIWQERLSSLWHKRFSKSIPKNFVDFSRQMRFLQYRGFDIVQIKNFINKKIVSK